MAYLELDRVAKQFGAQTVVDDFSLSVGKGESLLALFGRQVGPTRPTTGVLSVSLAGPWPET